jgi:TatA/E family protein of Tat protein translocase
VFQGFDTILMFESPVQIAVVLLIALVVFGPKRLPELGKQIGSGLRELNKAKNDLMRSINVDHEPDPEPYHYNYPTEQEANASPDYYNTYPDYSAPPDLTDYTIAKPVGGHAPEGTIARTESPSFSDSLAATSEHPTSHGSGAASTSPTSHHEPVHHETSTAGATAIDTAAPTHSATDTHAPTHTE